MSFDNPYHRPATPPGKQLERLEQPAGAGHSRNASDSSVYSNDSSPWSVVTAATSPRPSPPRYHHGTTLLPKIRSQDVVIEPTSAGGPQRHHRVLSNTRNPPGFIPYPSRRPVQRNAVESADGFPLVSPISATSVYGSGNGSALSSPVNVAPTHKRKATRGHVRSGSVPNLEGITSNRYGYPTYTQGPQSASLPQASPTTPITPNIIVYPSCPQIAPVGSSQCSPVEPMTPTPPTVPTLKYGHGSKFSSAQPSPIEPVDQTDKPAPSTTLLSYLTSSTQVVNLVRNVSVIPTRGMHDYFWWDIRNLRSWASFSLPTFNSISGLIKLLKTEIPSNLTPKPAISAQLLTPEAESALVNLVQEIYAPRVNAALAVSQGPEHLKLYLAPSLRMSGNKHNGGPHFLGNYDSDTECTSAGSPRGRLVGVVKSFDRWNSGMRNEEPHRRVEYLNGLAHLQRCMREHSCRYGFIMTEIELVCVRAGCDHGDDVPYFGYLEVSAPIPTKTASDTCPEDLYSPASDVSSRSDESTGMIPSALSAAEALNVPMTASLALYFLLMLSKSVPLPSQPSAYLNVGGPGALTRQRILTVGKDKWIPEPQIGERRDAKRVRGWVWPQDAWHRREGGISRAKNTDGRVKRWHK